MKGWNEESQNINTIEMLSRNSILKKYAIISLFFKPYWYFPIRIIQNWMEILLLDSWIWKQLKNVHYPESGHFNLHF